MSRELIVVGGGIVGASAALFADRNNWSVTLLERDEIGARASSAAAGILSPPFFLDPDQPPETQNTQPLLSRKGYDFYPEILEVLREYTTPDVGHKKSGMWYLAFDEEEYEEQKTIHREMKKYDRSVRWAEGNEIAKELPRLSNEVKGGFLFKEEAQVDPIKLMETLKTSLEVSDVSVRPGTPAHRLETGNANSIGVRIGGAVLRCDAVLVACGSWTPQILSHQPIELPIEPRKGEMLRVEAPDLQDYPPVRRGERFVLPRSGDAILGSTVEETGKDITTTSGAVRELLNAGKELVPSIDKCVFKETWAGLRPYAAKKGGAFLGEVADCPGVYYAAGHYKTGILQGPFTGKLMANYIDGRDTVIDVERYGVDR